MNEPIISPWLFYICGVCSSISNLLDYALILSGIGIVIFGCLACIDRDFADDGKTKLLKKIVVAWFVVGLINSFIPSKTVIYQMIIANNITQQNIEKVNANISVLIDKIIEASKKWENKK